MSRVLSISLLLGILSFSFDARSAGGDQRPTFTLPADIAEALRARNHDGRGGCPESKIFVHGFHHLDVPSDRVMWFLGAPDYLCQTNSFLSVILDSEGSWVVGQTTEDDWSGSRMLPGVPTFFRYSNDLGYFVTTEWQVEGPGNFLYYSSDGVAWTSVDLPDAATKLSEHDCCFAPLVRRLCLADSGELYISYEETGQFHASEWVASVADAAFPGYVHWEQVERLPDFLRCDSSQPGSFIPRSLRQKTEDGVVFDVGYNRSVLIPGPTE